MTNIAREAVEALQTAQQQVEALEAQLAGLRVAAAAERKALAKSVKPQMLFSVLPDESRYDKVYDPTITKWRLNGKCLNKEAVEAVGGRVQEGGMSFLYNTVTGRLVMWLGGGTVWISNHTSDGSRPVTDFAAAAVDSIESFIAAHPEGGDVTLIVERHKRAKACHHNGLFASTHMQPGDTMHCASCDVRIDIADL